MRRAALLVTLLALAGCGRVSEVRERDVVVRGGDEATRDLPERPGRGLQIATARIVVVTHGQASDQFWTIVKRGITEARRQTGAAVSYRAPDRVSIDSFRPYVDESFSYRNDWFVV